MSDAQGIDPMIAARLDTLSLLEGLLGRSDEALSVRDVLDRLFEDSQSDLPHDAMSISFVSDEQTHIRLHTTSGALRHLDDELESPIADETLLTRPWEFEIIDDQAEDPRYRLTPSAQSGMRSVLVIPLRFAGRLRGWVNFFSKSPRAFTRDHEPAARRLAAHVALTLSYELLAEQGRRNEELRAQKTNLELLDALLASLIESADLASVFTQISAIAAKVLQHDAMLLMARLPDGVHGRVYASAGFPIEVPPVTSIPKELLEKPDWEYDIVDDLSTRGEGGAPGVRMGFHSLLRLPIRLEGRLGGALAFFSKPLAAFKRSDILVARRIADRLTLAFARERETEATRRADEASDRASKLESRVRALTEELDARTGYRRVVGDSPQWKHVLTQATQAAPTDVTVLLLGDSGTGKEVVARFLHRASKRANGPFLALNCAALPEHLLEAELFGYERGAFTGATQSKPGHLEQAAGGTLFLDEVGEMSPPAQAKFLRVLQEREFQRLGGTRVLRSDARIVAATNRDLQKAIRNGHFREDLYYRLNVFAISLPRLRQRPEDILPLSEAFLAEIGKSFGRPPAGISRQARQILISYAWPGNVRELRNILERAAILCDGGLITEEHLALDRSSPPIEASPPADSIDEVLIDPPKSEVTPMPSPSSADLPTMERAMIAQALQEARFNKSKAAKKLGLTRHQLYLRMRKHGLD
jgi:two-component system response regulator AtoC